MTFLETLAEYKKQREPEEAHITIPEVLRSVILNAAHDEHVFSVSKYDGESCEIDRVKFTFQSVDVENKREEQEKFAMQVVEDELSRLVKEVERLRARENYLEVRDDGKVHLYIKNKYRGVLNVQELAEAIKE